MEQNSGYTFLRNPKRTIICVDMDAYFVSVEQALNPMLKGKPCAVIGSAKRSVIVTSSYEARKLGVKTGMNQFQASQVCPELIYIIGRPKIYSAISKEISNYLYNITPDVAVFSIDEAFIDITGVNTTAEEASAKIKNFVKDKFDITCTVGVGSNMLLAKMATNKAKPNGFYKVDDDNILEFIDSFNLNKIWGIGRGITNQLNALGVYDTKNVRALGAERLKKLFGKVGENIFNLVSGIYTDNVKIDHEAIKSISHSMTFPEDLTNSDEAYDYLLQLSEMVSSRARRKMYTGDVVTLTVRKPDMSTNSYQANLGFKTAYTHHIFDMIKSLYDDNIDGSYNVRLLGVTLSRLKRGNATSITVDDILRGDNEKKPKIYNAIDKVNEKFGEGSLTYARVLNCKRKGSKIISPSWRPDGDRAIDYTDDDD